METKRNKAKKKKKKKKQGQKAIIKKGIYFKHLIKRK